MEVASTPGGCAYPLMDTNLSGSLVVDGGPLGPSAAGNVTVTIGYSAPYRVYNLANGTLGGFGCTSETTTATTAANGSFHATLSVPPQHCTMTSGGWVCDVYTTPTGPVIAASADPTPSGYALSQRSGPIGPKLSLSFVWELASVTIAPGGATIGLSSDAPSPFVATGWMANGTPSPLATVFAWTLAGSGWSFDGGSEGAAVRVVGATGAALGNLSVRASAEVGTTALDPPPVAVNLLSVATTIAKATVDASVVDAGGTVTVSLTGSGAAGYSYGAWVDPGLGLAPVPAMCSEGAPSQGVLPLSCATTLSYPAAGLAMPSVNLTNGFSTATEALPPVTVVPSAELVLRPTAPVGYVAARLPLDLEAVNGTGVTPYLEACVASGDGTIACDTGPGPSWSFDSVYPAAGSYNATAWTIDGGGTNRSLTFPVMIVPPLAVGAIALNAPNMTAGVPVVLSTQVAGGDLPARFWWNLSGVAVPAASGLLTADGTVSTGFLPGGPGVVGATLVVADALGSVVRVQARFAVAAAPATRVVPTSVPPPPSVVDGSVVRLGWVALDRAGEPVPSFAPALELVLGSAVGVPRAWVNASAVGPLEPLGEGAYAVPSSAWFGGELDLTVVPASAGTLSVALVGSAVPGADPRVNLTVVPDTRQVRLLAPLVRADQPRSNATFWRVEDRFGNAVPGAVLSVVYDFGGKSTVREVTAVATAGGESGVWINYTAPIAGGGTVTVVDAAGVTVLGPLSVPAAPPTVPLPAVVLTAAGLPLVAVGLFAVVRRRRRVEPEARRSGEEELLRLAEGRERLLGILRRIGPADLAAIEAAWQPPPAPPELADWLASLVADGTLGATWGPDRTPRFRVSRTAPPPPIELDAALLAEALRRRDDEALSA